MLELSLEKMKRLAEIVYPGRQWLMSEERGVHYVISLSEEGSEFWRRFKPSLAGSDLEQAQALRVIVAAYDRYRFGCFVCNGDCRKDILHASALALLGDKA